MGSFWGESSSIVRKSATETEEARGQIPPSPHKRKKADGGVWGGGGGVSWGGGQTLETKEREKNYRRVPFSQRGRRA